MNQANPGRVLGVDLGSKRIGIAVSDARRTLASPLTVLDRTGSVAADHQRIAALADEEEVTLIVVGLPVTLDGHVAIAARAVKDEVAELEGTVSLPVETWDERMTTAAAHKSLAGQNLNSKQRRQQVDKWAAAEILQGWLDRHHRFRGLEHYDGDREQ